MGKYFALVDAELGVLGVGRTGPDAVRDYAEWMMTESDHEDTLEEQIGTIQESVNDGSMMLTVEECTKELYLDFKAHGNMGSYATNDVGLLDVWPEDEDTED